MTPAAAPSPVPAWVLWIPLITVILSGLVQFGVAWFAGRAALQKGEREHFMTRDARLDESRREKIRDGVAALLNAVDPDIYSSPDIPKATMRIHEISMLLQLDVPIERAAHDAASALGLAALRYRDAIARRDEEPGPGQTFAPDDSTQERLELLKATGDMINVARAVILAGYPAKPPQLKP